MPLTADSPQDTLTFAALLVEWRKRRRLHRTELALQLGMPARRLQLIERGEERPSPALVAELVDVLRLPPHDGNLFFAAAGYPLPHHEGRLEDLRTASAVAIVRSILARHDPLPAVVFDDRWDIVMVNEGYAQLLTHIPAADGPVTPLTLLPLPRLNLLTLLTAPDGYRLIIVNAPDVLRALLGRVRRKLSARGADPALLALVRMWLAEPQLNHAVGESESWESLLVPIHLHWKGREGRFVSSIAQLSTALDTSLQQLSIEQFHPVDEASEAAFRAG